MVDYNAFDDHSILESTIPVPVGSPTVVARFRRGDGMAGSISLEIDGTPCGEVELPLYMRMISSVGSSIGYDHGSAVSRRYGAPFPFSGELHEVEIQLSPGRFADADAASARAEMGRQ